MNLSPQKLFARLVFLGAVCASALAFADTPQLIEVRFYHFRSAEKAESFDNMMEKAAMPVMEGEGIKDILSLIHI